MKAKLKVISPQKIAPIESALLEINNLRKVFQVGDTYLDVLEGINFTVTNGELICILGRSGCGKSTLLKILAGFLPPTSGSVLLNGQTVKTPGPDRCVVFQEDTLFPWLTVQENIAFGLKTRKMKKTAVRKKVDLFLSLVGLTEFKNYLPKEISAGMKQRVALARVLILKPNILLMDEPFASLDTQTREEMQNLLLSLRKKLSHTVLFVTHDVNEAVTLADRILVMDMSPGRFREEMSVDLKRPRKKESREFLYYSQHLYAILRR